MLTQQCCCSTFGALTQRDYASVGQKAAEEPTVAQTARLWNSKTLMAPLPGTNLSPRRVRHHRRRTGTQAPSQAGIAGYSGHIPYAREVFGRNYQVCVRGSCIWSVPHLRLLCTAANRDRYVMPVV